jgi:hypothetical protein
MNRLSTTKRVQVVATLVEGTSINAIVRITQGNRIWTSQAHIAGREVDFGSIDQIGDGENRHFEGHVRAN